MYQKVDVDCFVENIEKGNCLQIKIESEPTPEGSECSLSIVGPKIKKLIPCEYGDKKQKTIKLPSGFKNSLSKMREMKAVKAIIDEAYEKCAVL